MFNNFTLALENANPFSFDYNRQLYYIKKSVQRINQFPVLVDNNHISEVQELPILILSPGPSLRRNAKWLQQNQNKFITIAFGATVKILHELDVVPDIITSVDSSTLIRRQFPKECKKTYKNSIALLGTDTLKDIFTLFKKEQIFVFEPNLKVTIDGIKESSALTVGDNTMHLLLSMGFKEIYMLGTDLAIDIEDEVAYDKTHFKSAKEKHNLHHFKKNIKKIFDDIDVTSNYVQVESNFGNKTVYSEQLFLRILEGYTSIINMHKGKYTFEIFNLSGGAFIPNTKPLQPEKIKLPNIKKRKEKIFLQKFFLKKSQKFFSDKDKVAIQIEIDFLNELAFFIKDVKNISIKDTHEFYKLRKKYVSKIIEHSGYSLVTLSVLLSHVKTIDNYINYILNDESIIYNKNKIQSIKMEWCKQILNKLKEYKKIIKKALI